MAVGVPTTVHKNSVEPGSYNQACHLPAVCYLYADIIGVATAYTPDYIAHIKTNGFDGERKV
jgi:hypothetical protein